MSAPTKDDLPWEVKAKVPLDVLIVGAGIAGLTAAIGLKQTGHNVVVLEQVSSIAEVGAGILLAPNSTRILSRLGLLEELSKRMTFLQKNSLRRWKNDEELGTVPLMPQVNEQYGAPIGVIHRGDLQATLLQAAKNQGVEIRTAARVTKAEANFEAQVQLQSGEWLSGDIIIAADGIKSSIRHQIAASHGHVDKVSPTGNAAYRILIPRESMGHDETALKMLDSNVGMRWMGPGGHIMAYPVKNHQVYNMVLLHNKTQDQEADESWNRKGDKKEMMEIYKDWNATVQNFLSYVPDGEVVEWTLNSHRLLPAWHQNKVILIGDACHPMLPYVAQGAAQAIEDSGALAAIFTQITSKSEIPTAISIYEHLRKSRGERIQQSADANRKSLHLPDGPAQEERDQKIRQASSGQGQNPDLLADSEWQDFMWHVDVMKSAIEDWDALKAEIEG